MASKAKTALLCAYTLARAGQYAEAEALILSHDELSKTPEAIDLLARIRMEEGDLAEARRLWQGIQSIYPEHKPSRVALKVIDKRNITIPWKTLSACAMLFAFLLGAGVTFFCCKPAPKATSTQIVWHQLPSMALLEELAIHKGTVKRVCISSRFFVDPKRVVSRAVLTEYVAKALEIPEESVFLGSAPESFAEKEILLTVEHL